MDAPVSGPDPSMESGLPAPHPCGLCDRDAVRRIADVLLLGLATACVDNTTGDPFRSPTSVAVEIKKEMVEHLARTSESYVAEAVVGEDGVEPDPPLPDHPADAVSDLAEDFAAGKRNLLGRVSGWLLSESREDKIDDFVQEMDAGGFWLPDRRATVAEPLLRNVDFKGEFHCPERFATADLAEEHRGRCAFRLVGCPNEGCRASVCAGGAGEHDATCPFKVLPCEQGCGASVVRREMDRHCVTVCPMRLVKCPFHQVGCRSVAVPQCGVAAHCEEFLHFHLLHVLQNAHKKEELTDELKEHALLLEKSQSSNELSKALDVRSLTFAIKEQEAKLKKLEGNYSVDAAGSKDV